MSPCPQSRYTPPLANSHFSIPPLFVATKTSLRSEFVSLTPALTATISVLPCPPPINERRPLNHAPPVFVIGTNDKFGRPSASRTDIFHKAPLEVARTNPAGSALQRYVIVSSGEMERMVWTPARWMRPSATAEPTASQ